VGCSERQYFRTVAGSYLNPVAGGQGIRTGHVDPGNSHQLGLAYNTVYRLHHLFRTAILSIAEDAASLKGEIELDESYFGGRRKGKRGRGAAGKVPVFGILERGGKVRVEVVQNVKGETLLDLTIQKVKRGSLVYTDRFQRYNGLVSYGFRHKRIDHGKRFVNGKVYINGIEGFWSFAKERLRKYHGVDRRSSRSTLRNWSSGIITATLISLIK
jgi:transposase